MVEITGVVGVTWFKYVSGLVLVAMKNHHLLGFARWFSSRKGAKAQRRPKGFGSTLRLLCAFAPLREKICSS